MGISPIYVAESQGFFKAEGLDVKFVSANGDSVAQSALDSGSAQFAASTAVNQIAAIGQGRPFKIVSTISYPLYSYVISAKKAGALGFNDSMSLQQRVQLFNGLRIGVASVGGASDLVIRKLLNDNGISDKSQKVTAVGATAIYGALKSGALDAGFLGEPDLSQAESQGIAVSVIPANMVPWLNKVPTISIATTSSYARSHPGVVKDMTAALQKAFTLIQGSPSAAESATKTYFSKIDPAVFTKMWSQDTTGYPAQVGMTEAEFNGAIQQNVLVGTGKKIDVAYSDAVLTVSP